MNKARRKQIEKAREQVVDLVTAAAALVEEFTAIRDEEQEAFDNLPESLQEAEQGQQMQAAIEALDSVVATFEEIEGSDVEDQLNAAVE